MEKEPELVVTVKDKVCVLRLNRPKKKNALGPRNYMAILETLDMVAADPNILILAVTGTGDYFTSGNEFSMEAINQALNADSEASSNTGGKMKTSKRLNEAFHRFVSKLIDFPKPLIAVVNGPAVGVGVTMLGLFDVVFASERATFHTPFITLALVAEGCSSYTFPRMMGPGKAAEMLMFGKKITANEACQQRLVTEVFPDDRLGEVWPRIYQWAQLPPNSMLVIKQVIRAHNKDVLHKVNDLECTLLGGRFKDEEFMTTFVNKFVKKSKL